MPVAETAALVLAGVSAASGLVNASKATKDLSSSGSSRGSSDSSVSSYSPSRNSVAMVVERVERNYSSTSGDGVAYANRNGAYAKSGAGGSALAGWGDGYSYRRK